MPPVKAPAKFLVPHVAWPDLRRITCLALVGALVAGSYGILHDQLTFTLSPEYFTRLKFAQFQWAEIGLPPRGLVAEIGFLATWWVGGFATWFFARIAAPRLEPAALVKACTRLWCQLFACALACGSLGYLLGPRYYLQSPAWLEALTAMELTDPQAFAQVAGIHLGGYLGALGGWLWALFATIKLPLRHA
jgi:hypothetical protein